MVTAFDVGPTPSSMSPLADEVTAQSQLGVVGNVVAVPDEVVGHPHSVPGRGRRWRTRSVTR